jgi:hypothetical protein
MAELSPERWRRLSPHLDRALAMPAEERIRYLAEVRADDAELADDLEGLLAARSLGNREAFLEGTPSLPPPPPSLAGQTFGAYTLLSLIGQGGMGNVWLARRSDGRFEGAAAVKLLNASLVGRAGEHRFRREGNILARLADPHIARLSTPVFRRLASRSWCSSTSKASRSTAIATVGASVSRRGCDSFWTSWRRSPTRTPT